MAGFRKSNKDFYKKFGDKNTLKQETYKILASKFKAGKGRDKKIDKENGVMDKYIYTNNTHKTYRQQSYRFVNWLKENYPEIKNMQQVKKYHINKYLSSMIEEDLSPYTISMAKSALSKLKNIPYAELLKTPARERRDVFRSRYKVSTDDHIAKDKKEYFARITSATGLRRAEITRIKGTDLKYSSKGYYYLEVTKGTKGGRPRKALILGETKKDTEYIVNMFKNAQDRLVVPKLPKNLDNHHYRGVYAKRIYNKYARPIENLKKEDKYIMRKDQAGKVLDKKAMLITSKCLGHSRISVIAQSYLY